MFGLVYVPCLTGKELDSEEDDEDDAGQEYLKQLAKTVRIEGWNKSYFLIALVSK